ncbi:MAG: M20 family metallo-hydrolase [Desulfatiglans sp.]|nr:M20 family metallo-hydrolase [Thermodesulfobacteriota bacterium]MEE4353045.1 M20 family metallo-hydrolase [Desulfatiglans sp.]
MNKLDRVFERIDDYREEIIRLQSELSKRVALGPDNEGTGEHEKVAFMKGLLEALDPTTIEEIRAPDKRAQDGYRPNLIARWKETTEKPAVCVLSHADIVPPGDLSLWKTDPYTIQVDGDKIIGRGVEDNQHGFVSSYLALKAILESGETPDKPVALVVVADEETGSEYGLTYILEHRNDLFKGEDLIIVPDGGNEEGTMIEVAEKSMLWVRFTIIGEQCHASTPDKGKNSLFSAAKLIVALSALKERFDLSDELFKPPLSTFEPTKIEGNVPNVNTIPGRDVFYMDCRVLPHYKVDEILEAINKIAKDTASELGVEISVDVSYRQDATDPTPSDAPVVEALKGAIRTVTGKVGRPMGIGGGTVAAFFRKAGLPAVVWSTMSDTPHRPNEYCLISNIMTDAKIFSCLYGVS